MKDISQILTARPFKVRNADEFNLTEVLHRFINPRSELYSPFEYESSILRGQKGTGKTMYLRANYALYQYDVYPAIIEGRKLHIPIFLSLSKFQHINEPKDLYKSIMFSLCEGLAESYKNILDSEYMRVVHMGMQTLPESYFNAAKIRKAGAELLRLNVDRYVETIESQREGTFGVKSKFFELVGKTLGKHKEEFSKSQDASISSLIQMHKTLLDGYDADLLILLDEAGSLNKDFFSGERDSSSFEIMLNQFRTSESIRCKIAVYPESPSDKVSDTRYGDRITLEEDIDNQTGYTEFRSKTFSLIKRYINDNCDESIAVIDPSDVFEVCDGIYGDCLEQIIYGSSGNMRLLVQLLDLALAACHHRSRGSDKVNHEDVQHALSQFSYNSLSTYSESEKQLLSKIATDCKRRTAFRFSYKYNTLVLNRLASRSEEYNHIIITAPGVGRAPTTYKLDYCTCVREGIPTHVMAGEGSGGSKINRNRTLKDGQWNNRKCSIEDSNEDNSSLLKVDGNIIDLPKDNKLGTIVDRDGAYYHFFPGDIRKDENKILEIDITVSFIPVILADGKCIAHTITID